MSIKRFFLILLLLASLVVLRPVVTFYFPVEIWTFSGVSKPSLLSGSDYIKLHFDIRGELDVDTNDLQEISEESFIKDYRVAILDLTRIKMVYINRFSMIEYKGYYEMSREDFLALIEKVQSNK